MRSAAKDELKTAAAALKDPLSDAGGEIAALLALPPDAPPRRSAAISAASVRSKTVLNPLELLLGVMTAVGGFVDVSELTFAAQAGSTFGYSLIWVFAFATIGIMVFGEMSGRVAAVTRQPVFNLMRHRLGLKLGLLTLAASLVSNLITCAAEIGGVAIILHQSPDHRSSAFRGARWSA
ncbi:MAG: divalent metal cation transporter [Croceibacterium sp.]